MKTKNTLNKSKSKSKRNPSEDCAAVMKALTTSADTSFGILSNTGDSVTKMPSDGVSINSPYVCSRLIEQAEATDPLRTTEEDELRFIDVCETIRGLQPRNTLESMLCTQMIGVHNLIMESLRRASLREGGSAETNQAARLGKVFLEQVATRERLRGKFAQQHMTVKHIHVESGAKAVVGVVQIEESKNEQKSEL